MSLHIIVTRDTFDKRYDEVRGELTFSESHLPAILRQVRVTLPITLEEFKEREKINIIKIFIIFNLIYNLKFT